MLQELNALVDQGRYLAAKRLVQGILNSPDVLGEDKAKAALVGSQVAMMTREAFVAWTFARKALELAQEVGSEELEGQALFSVAAARLAIGDYAEVRIYLRQFIDGFADRWPELEPAFGARAFGNLGMALTAQRLYPDAMAAFTSCLARLERTGNTHGQIRCSLQMAWCLMQAGIPEEAKDHLDRAASIGGMPADLLPHFQSHTALYHLHVGDFGKAMEQATELLDPGRSDVTDATRAVGCYVTGMAALAQQDWERARMFADLATDFATKDGLASLLNLVATLRREVLTAPPRADSDSSPEK